MITDTTVGHVWTTYHARYTGAPIRECVACGERWAYWDAEDGDGSCSATFYGDPDRDYASTCVACRIVGTWVDCPCGGEGCYAVRCDACGAEDRDCEDRP